MRRVVILQDRSQKLSMRLPMCYRSVRCQMNNKKQVLKVRDGVVTVDVDGGLVIFDCFTK